MSGRRLPPRDASGGAIPRPFSLGEALPDVIPGAATGEGNNCLIRTLSRLIRGKLGGPAKRPGRDKFCVKIRRRLAQDSQCRPTDFLGFEVRAAQITQAFGRDPSCFTITCFARDHTAGPKVGRGPVATGALELGGQPFCPHRSTMLEPRRPEIRPCEPADAPPGTVARKQLPLPPSRSLPAEKDSYPGGEGRGVSRRFRLRQCDICRICGGAWAGQKCDISQFSQRDNSPLKP